MPLLYRKPPPLASAAEPRQPVCVATPEFEIRAYVPADREAIRRICFETGYMGESIEWIWRDRDSFADLITRYYTDREPESILVATRSSRVVGYLTGCVDSQRTRGAAVAEIRRLALRGALLRPGFGAFLARALLDTVRDRGVRGEALFDARWPAHLHIDFLPEGRGRGLGRRLMQLWFERLRGLGTPGVHLGTFAENRAAIGFFEGCGLARQGAPIPAPGFRMRDGRRMHVQWMARSL
jgi:ribosomal protein S18 acetylase RimI-like enzyme